MIVRVINLTLGRFVSFIRSLCRETDLRFEDKAQESAFRKTLEKRLVLASLCHFCCCIFILLVTVSGEEGVSFKVSFEDPQASRLNILIAIFVLIPVFLAFLAIIWLNTVYLRFLDWELLDLLSHTLLTVTLPWINGWTMAKVYGKDPDRFWDKDMRAGEGNILLFLDCIITLLCLFVPMRMCMKWIPPIFGVASFFISATMVGSPFPGHTKARIAALCVLAICALWGAWSNERVARNHFIAQRLVQRKSRELDLQSASNSRILERLCDSLLHLGPNFTIVDPDPRFAALLLSSSQDGLAGNDFLQYLASDLDRAHFTSALHGRVSAATPCEAHASQGMVQVRLCDSHGREFTVYAYHASVFDCDGECGHMVAIVEAQEREALEASDQREILPLEESSANGQLSKEDKSSKSSDYSSGCEVWRPTIGANTGDIAAWVNVASSGLDIIRVSAGFTVFGPITMGSGLEDMTVGDASVLRNKLQRAVNCLIRETEITVEPFSLRLRATPNASVEFTTRCSISSDVPDWIDDRYPDGDCLLRLVFSEVRCQRRRHTGGKSKKVLARLRKHSQHTRICL